MIFLKNFKNSINDILDFIRKEFLAKRKRDKFSMYFLNDESFDEKNKAFSFLKKNKFNP
jgi:hypothetical protein